MPGKNRIRAGALQDCGEILKPHTAIGIATCILVAIGALGSSPSPAPSTSPTSSASPRPRLFARGPQFVSLGAAVDARVRSEFQAGSTSARTSFEGWLSSESTIDGKFHVLSFTDYRSFSYDHYGNNPVTTVGGAGVADVPSFRVSDDQLESGGGVRIAPRLFFGGSFVKQQESTGYPALKGIGYTMMFAPAEHQEVTPYGWVTYEPNIGGIYALPTGDHTALTYRGVRYRAGLLATEPHSRMFFDVGFAGEILNNRTNAPARVSDSMFTIGLGTKF